MIVPATKTDLIQATEENQFILYYQPIVNLESGEIESVEALIRWVHPKEGLLFPGSFLPSVVACEFEVKLDIWVTSEAIATIRKLGIPIAVNIHCLTVESPAFIELLSNNLDVKDLLTLELSESCAFAMHSEALSFIQGMGFCLALDDFGTGYANLNTLVALPVDVLKIDRIFLSRNGRSDLLLKTIIELAKLLELKVVAEGVETNDQAGQLLMLGVSLAQGFLLHKPMSLERLQELL